MGQRRKKTSKAGPAAKKPIEQYEHAEKRANNPHVGLVGPENDPDSGRKTYAYEMTDQDKAKRVFMQEWVDGVNAHGGFGRWACAVSCSPSDVPDLLAKHA